MRKRGFTITEMLFVVLIIGLISGAGTGLYVGTFKKLRVQRAAYDFLLTAKYGRIMAIEQQSRYTMQLDAAGNGFLLTTLAWDEENEQASEQVVRDPYCKPVQFEGDVVFEDVQIAPDGLETESESDIEDEQQQSIVFSPNGTAQLAGVQIGDGRTHYTISISAATGRAKIYYGTAENVKATTTDLDAES
ncbi:MAG: pilus assembly FimT family protein [Planctomycetota bacterium]|jgi:prepilin-type N-terminal cleavage/methylation domain-containing protein